MKPLIILIGLLLFSSQLIAKAKIEFEQKSINKIYMIEGESYTYEYRFMNTGDQPLFIQSCRGNANFIPTYPKKPIMPNEEGIITVNYKPNIGTMQKTIRVQSNGGNVTLSMKGQTIKGPTKVKPFPVIHFENTEFDDGKIKRGPSRNYNYPFKNIGNAPLLISQVKTPCGCHAASWPKDPIMPGQSSIISNRFITKGKGLGLSRHGTAHVKCNSIMTAEYIYLRNKSIIIE